MNCRVLTLQEMYEIVRKFCFLSGIKYKQNVSEIVGNLQNFMNYLTRGA